jgi:transcriptional regulator with XRE-family HTH domain
MDKKEAEKTTRYICNELKEIRNNRHLTQEDVAFALNISAGYLSRIENGKLSNTPMYLFIQFCDLYQIEFDKLIKRAYAKINLDNYYKQ